MTSTSRQERSQISITFVLGRESDGAAADVRDRVGRARGKLPDEIDEPVIQKVEADAQAIMYLAFTIRLRRDDLARDTAAAQPLVALLTVTEATKKHPRLSPSPWLANVALAH